MQFSFDHIFFNANYRTPDIHRHFAKHIIFARQGELECLIDGKAFNCRGVVIQSNVPHTVNVQSSQMSVYLFDETCNRSKQIDEMYICGKNYALINDETCNTVSKVLNESDADEKVLKILGLDSCGAANYDERIADVLSFIESSETLEAGIMEELCRVAYLSESRLSHLFREQVGISVAGYLLLTKLAKTYSYLSEGENITQAAIKAGFASPSHFAAVNKRQFGISATDFGSLIAALEKAEK